MTVRERGGALADRAICYAEAAVERVELPDFEVFAEVGRLALAWYRDDTPDQEQTLGPLVNALGELAETAALSSIDSGTRNMQAVSEAIAEAFVIGYQAGQDDIGRSERSLGGTAEERRRRGRRDGATPHDVRTERRERGGSEQHRAACSCKWTSSWQPGPGAAGMAREAAALHAKRMTHGSGR